MALLDTIRSSTSKLTPFFLYLLVTCTGGTLLFGFHLAELNAPQEVITCVRSGIGKQSVNLPSCIPMTPVQIGLVSSIYTVGGLIGALPAGQITARYGRLLPMRVNTFISLLGSIAEAFAPSIPIMAIGRFISGIAAGSSTVIVPLYISEISPPGQKGFFGAFTQISTNTGIFVTQLIGYFLSHGQYWRLILAVAGMIGMSQLVALMFAVESPVWAAENSMKPQAKEILKRLRGEEPEIREEVPSLRDSIEGFGEEEQTLLSETSARNEPPGKRLEPVGFFEIVTKKQYLPAVIAVIAIMMAQQLCGINSVIMYGVSLLSTVLSTGSALLNIFISILNIVITTACAPLSDVIGRKACILGSIAGMGVASVMLGIGLRTVTPLLSAISVLVFVASFGFGLGPVPFIMASELVGPEAVGAAQSWALASNWISTFLVAQFFPLLNEKLGKGVPYFIFAGMALFFFTFILWWVPETKGKMSIDQVWGRETRED